MSEESKKGRVQRLKQYQHNAARNWHCAEEAGLFDLADAWLARAGRAQRKIDAIERTEGNCEQGSG